MAVLCCLSVWEQPVAGSCGIGAAGTATAPRDSEQSLARESGKILSRSFLSSGHQEEVFFCSLFSQHILLYLKLTFPPPSTPHTPPSWWNTSQNPANRRRSRIRVLCSSSSSARHCWHGNSSLICCMEKCLGVCGCRDGRRRARRGLACQGNNAFILQNMAKKKKKRGVFWMSCWICCGKAGREGRLGNKAGRRERSVGSQVCLHLMLSEKDIPQK